MFWWNRPDGELVKDLPLNRRVMPYIMKGRNESAFYFDYEVTLRRTDEFVRAFNAAHPATPIDVFHVAIYALRETMYRHPTLNRFVAGGRLYQRRDVWFSYAVKRKLQEGAPFVVVKRRFPADESVRGHGLGDAGPAPRGPLRRPEVRRPGARPPHEVPRLRPAHRDGGRRLRRPARRCSPGPTSTRTRCSRRRSSATSRAWACPRASTTSTSTGPAGSSRRSAGRLLEPGSPSSGPDPAPHDEGLLDLRRAHRGRFDRLVRPEACSSRSSRTRWRPGSDPARSTPGRAPRPRRLGRWSPGQEPLGGAALP